MIKYVNEPRRNSMTLATIRCGYNVIGRLACSIGAVVTAVATLAADRTVVKKRLRTNSETNWRMASLARCRGRDMGGGLADSEYVIVTLITFLGQSLEYTAQMALLTG